MGTIATAFLGNHAGQDGIQAFSREILFRTAGEWAAQILPKEQPLFYFHAPNAPNIPQAQNIPCQDNSYYHALLQQQALMQADSIFIMSMPMPELSAQDINRFIAVHESTGQAVTIMCCDGSGNEPFALMRDGDDSVISIGCGEGERALHAAIFRTAVLKRVLAANPTANTLFDLFNAASTLGCQIGAARMPTVTEVVTGQDAYAVQKKMVEQLNLAHIARGVMIFAPDSTYIAQDAQIAAGAVILPGTLIRSGCTIGAGASIGPNTILEQAHIGAGTSVNCSQVYESTIGAHTTVGPFAYIRPGCQVGDHARIGDFVELKKAEIGNGTKVSHLTYIGDASVGERVNFGCGTVVVNYDGYVKSKTEIGDDCFIGCNTNLVAPVRIGDRAFTAAGATVTADVPDGALAVARARQKNFHGWNDRRRKAHGQSCDSHRVHVEE